MILPTIGNAFDAQKIFGLYPDCFLVSGFRPTSRLATRPRHCHAELVASWRARCALEPRTGDELDH